MKTANRRGTSSRREGETAPEMGLHREGDQEGEDGRMVGGWDGRNE